MSFSKGDKVLVAYMGSPYDKREGIVVGRNENGLWLVAFDNDTPEPKWVEFNDYHLQFLEAANHKESAIKDSGERTEFNTGAVRDMHEGKGDMLSMPWAALLRVSRHYENGAKKYGRYNYLKGIPVSSFIDSAIRHLAKYVAGYDDEDHLSAAAFNILGAIQMEEHCPDMCDLPWRDGKRSFHYGDAQRQDCREEKNKTEERTPNLFDGN